jgi:uncharacterized short protein YbdD (DUF466 family)
MVQLFGFLEFLWNSLREVCGENDYEGYRAKVLASGGKVLTPGAFFLERLELKYSRPNRCC